MVDLLPEHWKAHAVVERDVVAVGTRGPEAVYPTRLKPTLGDDLVEQLLRVAEQLACRGALRRAVQDRGIFALQLPRVEEERPVDVLSQLRERRLDHLPASERWPGQLVERHPQPLGA